MMLPRVSPLFGMLVCASCTSIPRDEVLEALGADLEVVGSALKNAPFKKTGHQDVSVLWGMTAAEIQRALGAADCVGTPTNGCLEGAAPPP